MCLLMPPRGVRTHACVCTLMPCGDASRLTQIRRVSASLNARRAQMWVTQSHDAPESRRWSLWTSAQRVERVGQWPEQQVGPTYSQCLQLFQHLNRGNVSRLELFKLFYCNHDNVVAVRHLWLVVQQMVVPVTQSFWKTQSTFFCCKYNHCSCPRCGCKGWTALYWAGKAQRVAVTRNLT